MTLSPESVLALQRHFLGSLTVPARTWLEPLPAPRLAFAGSALRHSRGQCVLDFGTVETPGEERRVLRVFDAADERAEIRLADFPPWLAARWIDGTTLELLASHRAESDVRGVLRFVVGGTRTEELPVRMTTRRPFPTARFDFNGSQMPHPFDFGHDDGPYRLSVGNEASVPLVVSFADLPSWLMIETEGHRCTGPLHGRFFERAAPFTIRIRPQALGRHDGSLRIQTNDPRAELRTIDLRFAACTHPAVPCVRAAAPAAVRLSANQTFVTKARLENWGRAPARSTQQNTPRGLSVQSLPVIPPAADGVPGTATLPIRIMPSQLAPGTHALPLKVQIAGGDPEFIDVPVQVDVTAEERRTTPWRAALLSILLLTLAFYLVRGLP